MRGLPQRVSGVHLKEMKPAVFSLLIILYHFFSNFSALYIFFFSLFLVFNIL